MRDSVERSLHQWNSERGEAAGVILLPRRWETAAVPELAGTDGQSVINAQLVDDADIVVGIFHQTLGSATPRAASGTAEELERARDAGKPVHLYFSDMPIDRNHDRAQLEALDQFRDSVKHMGLYGSFETVSELESQVRRAIEFDITSLELAEPVRVTHAGAALSAAYKYTREPDGKGRMRTKRQRIVFRNTGDAPANNVEFTTTAQQEGQDAPILLQKVEPFDLAARVGEFSVPVLPYAGSATQVRVDFTWTEDGVQKTGSDSISML